MSHVLALNCGSSSLKYALFDGDEARLRGKVERIGAGNGGAKDHAEAVAHVFAELEKKKLPKPEAVGHRLVHGGPHHAQPERVTPALRKALDAAVPFAPLHLPAELRAVDAVRDAFGALPQVVCFDTAFHQTLPEVAYRYALPKALFDKGVRRYGFHGLSYEYVVSALPAASKGRAVIAHLGSGSSMVAVNDGVSIDTTMGFTPTGGLVMGTRPGDLDPGVLVHLLAHHGYDAKTLEHLVNHDAGLAALSETTPDMEALLAARARDPRAALAVDVYCYQARKWVGALAAALGGLDALVFTGGIGEHAAVVRDAICEGLGHLGLRDETTAAGSCTIHTIPTDEECVIARHTLRLAS